MLKMQLIIILTVCTIGCQISAIREKAVTTPSPVDALAQVVDNMVRLTLWWYGGLLSQVGVKGGVGNGWSGWQDPTASDQHHQQQGEAEQMDIGQTPLSSLTGIRNSVRHHSHTNF
jgi:hypothetical protein